MKLYNTLTRQIDEIKPNKDGKVNMFVCGPTVYDFAHIGHAKTYIQFDVLARVLKSNHELFYLQNITDVDDKIIIRAAEKNISWDELRSQYESAYYEDMKALNITTVNQYARATDYIEDIIRQVRVLMDKGHAYKIDDGIYFEIATFPAYGKLSGRQEVKENDAQARIDQSDQKRGWNDFCLWKFSKPGEPVWDAPFGKGRPGWHIEDTAITEHFFGPQYDLHGGAIDLIFPHHEAEITQMESASGKVPFVKYWVHTGFLNIDEKKMSKSLGNFFTIREVLEKGYDPMAVRVFMLQSHYRSPINFSWESLDAAQNRLKNLRNMAVLRWQAVKDAGEQPLYERKIQEIKRRLEDDLNTPLALAHINKIERLLENNLVDEKSLTAYMSVLSAIDELLGLDLSAQSDISAGQKALMAGRESARKAKDWAKADQLRDQLAEQGIGLRDTPHGAIWFRL
jgi:cysteinyl-tRNA synthetase